MMIGTPLSEEEIYKLLDEEKACWLATARATYQSHVVDGINDGD